MQEILKFVYENNDLCLFKQNDLYLFGKRKDGIVSYDVSLDEKKIIRKVFLKVISLTNIVNLGNFSFAKKDYLHFLDKDSGMHVFYEQTVDGLRYPSDTVQKELNYIFNHQKASVNVGKDSFKDKSFFRRVVTVGASTVVVLVSTYLGFQLWSNSRIYDDSQTVYYPVVSLEEAYHLGKEESKTPEKLIEIGEEIPFSYNENITLNVLQLDELSQNEIGSGDVIEPFVPPVVEEDPLTVAEIVSIIQNNPRLSVEEKDFFLQVKDYYALHLPYLNHKAVREQLKNLYIIYDPNPSDNNFGAEYFTSGEKKGAIVVYNATSFKDARKDYLGHENWHVKTDYSHYTFGEALYERLNVQITNETYGEIAGEYPYKKFDNSYRWLDGPANILFQILDCETLLKFHAVADPHIIIDALKSIIPDEDMAIKLLIDLDFINMYHMGILEHPEDYVDEYFRRHKEMRAFLVQYYEARYSTKVVNHPEIMFWLDKDVVFDEIASTLPIDETAKMFIPNFASIINYRKYFSNDSGKIIIRICSKVRPEKRYYTLEELLSLQDKDFKETDIPYPKMDDGTYEVVSYYPEDYVDIVLEDLCLSDTMTR